MTRESKRERGPAMAETLQEQLDKYLADAHSIEEQALQQLRAAPEAAGDPQIADVFQAHLVETEGHERAVRRRLEERDSDPSSLKDLLMRVGGAGFLLFAKSQPDTPGKLVAHAYSYEHMELAAYELLRRVAERAGDEATADTARRIRGEEAAMAQRLEEVFDRATEASLREVDPENLGEQLSKYLADAHAIEAQAIQLLEKGPEMAGDPELARLYADHLEETRGQQQLVEARLDARGGDPSTLKDAALRAGALNWGMFFQLHPDTPGKLAAFSYAFEHLEIAAYEELKLVADRAGDSETVRVCDEILSQERAAAEKIASAFDGAVEASLEAVGVG
jgi:ferritin-like metal-binding protein YciE